MTIIDYIRKNEFPKLLLRKFKSSRALEHYWIKYVSSVKGYWRNGELNLWEK